MFKLLNILKGIPVTDPHSFATASVALNRYRETGELLVQDSVLEEFLVPVIEDIDTVDAAALFGFRDCLRFLLHGRYGGDQYEAVIVIKPIGVEWKDETNTMSFSYDLEQIRLLNETTDTGIQVLKEVILSSIPFGGFFGMVAERVVGRGAKSMGLAAIESWGGVERQGVRLEKGVATVDLRVQPALNPIWSRLDFSSIPGGSWVEDLVNIVGIPVSVASMMNPIGIRADREGIHLQLGLTPLAETIFEATAGALKMGSKGFKRLMGGE